MITNKKLLDLFNSYDLDALKKALQDNIREENNKNAGKASSDLAILKRLMKINEANDKRSKLLKAHKLTACGEEKFCFLSDYYGFYASENFGYSIAEPYEQLDCKTLFNDSNDTETFEFDLKEVRVFAKETKKLKKGYTVEYNGKILSFNPQYLCDVCDWCQTNKITFVKIPNKLTHLKYPARVSGNDRKALILPISVSNGEKELEFMENWRKGNI